MREEIFGMNEGLKRFTPVNQQNFWLFLIEKIWDHGFGETRQMRETGNPKPDWADGTQFAMLDESPSNRKPIRF